jgi:hypothetical protein
VQHNFGAKDFYAVVSLLSQYKYKESRQSVHVCEVFQTDASGKAFSHRFAEPQLRINSNMFLTFL